MDDPGSLLVVVGGFLGTGKTTTILAAARRLRAEGQRVGIVTNDQASGLVDTALARQVGDAVAEIPEGCFCCRFDALCEALTDLSQTGPLDVILAEAVGSCTDLAATVCQPIRQLGRTTVRLAPLTVVVDAVLLRTLVRYRAMPVFPDTVAYLFERQLAEADVILLNKIDLLPNEEQDRLVAHLAERFPSAEILPISALTGAGLDPWLEHLAPADGAGDRVLDLDYDRYAAAEACLGWVNLVGTSTLPDGIAGEWVRLVCDSVEREARLAAAGVAHLKCLVTTESGTARGHLVSIEQLPAVVVEGNPGGAARILVNARAATSPEILRQWVSQAIAVASSATGTTFVETGGRALSPARPTPTYRLMPVAHGDRQGAVPPA